MTKIEVCVGSSCYVKGAQSIIDYFEKQIKERNLGSKIELAGAFCLENCGNGIAVKVNDKIQHILTVKEAELILNDVIKEG